MQILQQFSVTLSSVIIAIFVCNCLYFSSLKLQQISLITKFIDIYNSSNSRYIRCYLLLLIGTLVRDKFSMKIILTALIFLHIPAVPHAYSHKSNMQ